MKLNKEKLKEALKDTEIENFLDVDYVEADDEGELLDYIQECIYEQEVIYYATAMKYLLENDPSLNISLELAVSCGYSLETLSSSETLATLLYQDKLTDELNELDLSDCFGDESKENNEENEE